LFEACAGLASVERSPAFFGGEGTIQPPAAGPGNEADELIEASHVELGDDGRGIKGVKPNRRCRLARRRANVSPSGA
jgi:hypothetical protein